MRLTRCEPRLPFSTPVRVFGLDTSGRPVNAAGATVDVSRRGARISGVKHWEAPGEIIGLRHTQDKARYQIVWVGQPNTPLQGQIGLMCLEIGKIIWGAGLPEPTAAAAAAASDTGSFRASSILGPPTGSFRALADEAPPAGSLAPQQAPGLALAKTPNRRRAPRYLVEGGVHIGEQGALSSQWANVHDISAGGCYVETTSPLPLDARVEAALHISDFQFQARGVVANVDPMAGMGIKFTELTVLNRARLEALLATLAQSNPQA